MLTEATLQAIERTAEDAYDGLGLVSAAELAQLIAGARVANALEQWRRTDTLPAWRAIEAAHRIYTAHGPAEATCP